MSLLHIRLEAFLIEHGLDLLLGTTIVLATFALMLVCSRSLAVKHRLAGTAIVSVTAFVLFALAPMPRFAFAADAPTPLRDAPALSSLLTDPSLRPSTILAVPLVEVQGLEIAKFDPPVKGNVEKLRTRSTTARLSLLSSLVWLLIAGTAFFAAQLLLGWIRLRFILFRSEPAPSELARLVDLPRRTRLRITSARTQPFCCGLWRGTIVLPAHMATTNAETRFVLLHELAHLRAGDGRLRMIAALLRPALFWHPLFWWLQQQLRFTGELLADDAAARGSVPEYVRCMMKLATESAPSPSGPMVATVFRRRSELFRRLEMMLQRKMSPSPTPSRRQRHVPTAAAVALVTLCAGIFGVDRAVAQDPVRNQELRAEVKELRATIRKLRAEVAALESRRRASAGTPRDRGTTDDAPRVSIGGGAGGGFGAAPRSRYRVEKGDTIALVSKKVYGSAKHVNRLLLLNPDVDPAKLTTGQLLVINAPPPNAPNKIARANTPVGATDRRTTPRASASRHPQDGGMNALATLVSRAIELRGEVDIQAVELKYARAEVKQGLAGEKSVAIAKIRLDTTERQLEAITSILEGELRKAELELAYSKQLEKKGFVTPAEVQASKNRVMWIRQGLR